jgi:hypothetical protein
MHRITARAPSIRSCVSNAQALSKLSMRPVGGAAKKARAPGSASERKMACMLLAAVASNLLGQVGQGAQSNSSCRRDNASASGSGLGSWAFNMLRAAAARGPA